MKLRILTIDYETTYSDKYSLRRMTPVEYICDRRFEAIGAAVRVDEVEFPLSANPPVLAFTPKARWVNAPDLPRLFEKVDWSKTALMSHNIGFDGAIMAWRYGVVPVLYLDTLGMARATLPQAGGASLEKVLQHINAPPKGGAIKQAKGYRLADFEANPAYFQEYKSYCERDCDGCFWILEHVGHCFDGTAGTGKIHKAEEILVMDMVARMTITPQFSLDRFLLGAHLRKVVREKENLIAKLTDATIINPEGGGRADLLSNERFAQVLRNLGVDPPMKTSLLTGKEAYAFSKTDEAFTDLLEDENPLVQAVVAARLGVKSTQEETRTQRFINISMIDWPTESDSTVPLALAKGGTKGEIFPARMPFPLKYSGAHTHRLSGDWSLNLQNLGRASPLRSALVAPPGYKVVSADASQIEARIVSWLAGCGSLVGAFERGEDVYATLASKVFGFAVNKSTHPMERFVGKTAVLGLGFGMGAARFESTVWSQSQRQHRIDTALAQRAVTTYRYTYSEIPRYWRTMDEVIHALSVRASREVGPLIVDGITQSVILPNGMRLFYNNMRQDGTGQWMFDYGKRVKYIFPGKMCENWVQACARIITMNAATRIRRSARIGNWTPYLAGQVHDQLVYVVPEGIAEDFKKLVIEEMSRRLDWFHDLPLAAEGGIGDNLGECK